MHEYKAHLIPLDKQCVIYFNAFCHKQIGQRAADGIDEWGA